MPFARAAFAAAGGTAGPNGLIISGRHLAWASDTAGDPTTAMRATAQLISPTGTLAKTLKAYVDVGTAPGVYGTQIAANVVHLVGLYAIPHGPVSSQYYLKATITGLHPATIYHYRFRLSDGTVTGDTFFSTAPARTLLGTASANLKPFTFTAFADTGTDLPATDPKFAWGADPASVKAANGVWPRGSFDNHFYSASDPIAGTNGTDKTPATTQTLAIAVQTPAFALLAGDICYADPTGSGLPVDDVNSPKSAPPSARTPTTRTSGTRS